MGGDPRPFSISSLSTIYLPWFLENILNWVKCCLARRWLMYCVMWMLELYYFPNGSYLSPQSRPSVSSGYVPFCGRTEAVISHYWDLSNSSFQSALSQRLTFYIETDKRIITVSETIKLSRRNYPTLVSCVCFPDYLNIKTFPSSCQVLSPSVLAAVNKSIRRAPRKSCRHSIHHT